LPCNLFLLSSSLVAYAFSIHVTFFLELDVIAKQQPCFHGLDIAIMIMSSDLILYADYVYAFYALRSRCPVFTFLAKPCCLRPPYPHFHAFFLNEARKQTNFSAYKGLANLSKA
jgi:hypothetical protein